MIRRPPRSPLFPSPTLFRSILAQQRVRQLEVGVDQFLLVARLEGVLHQLLAVAHAVRVEPQDLVHQPLRLLRSEEHTSELQSRSDLVCRLLLEKKNNLDRLS